MLKKVFGALLFALLLVPLTAYAASSDTSANDITSQGLTVSPPIKELTIKPGNTEKVTIKLSNPTNSVLEVYPVVMDFTSKDDNGDPEFLDPSEKSRTYSLSSWIKFSMDKIALAPEQITSWDCEIVVPDDAGPGGHYGSILFSNKAPEELKGQNQVGIASMVASLLLVSVPGDIREQALVSEFSTPKSFYFQPPIDIITRITNNGNNHIAPVGNVVIKNWAGTQVANYAINETRGRILPEGTRKFVTTWENPGGPFYKAPIGRYSAELSAIYGNNSTQSLVANIAFWVIPLWFIFTVSGLLLAAIALIIFFRYKKKRRFLYS